MLLAVDVGNTNVSFGMVLDGDVTSARHAPTLANHTADDLEGSLDELLRVDGVELADVDEMVIASVVPTVSAAATQLGNRRGIAVLVVENRNVPIPIRVPEPHRVGDDRLVNAFAATRLYGTPAIVVDLGTATTFDAVAADGAFIGGAIAPGVGLGLDALASRTAQLPRVALVMPQRAIGRDTVSALQSGAVLGHIGLVHLLIRAISAELAIDGGGEPKVILTGGWSNGEWAQSIPGVTAIDPLLTLRGLALLHAEVTLSGSVAQA